MKKLSTTSLNRQFEEYYNAPPGGVVYISDSFKWRRIQLDLGFHKEIKLPDHLNVPFESVEFPFFKYRIFGFEELDEIFIHSKNLVWFFFHDFHEVRSNTFVQILYKQFDNDIRDILFFIFLSGYIEGIKSFETLAEENIKWLESFLEYPSLYNLFVDLKGPEINTEYPYESSLYNLFLENEMFQYYVDSIDDVSIFEYGFKNAITYKCWALIHDQPIESFWKGFEVIGKISVQRIKLETDTDTAMIYFKKLLNFEHRGRIERIFTEEQLDSFLRAHFVGFGEKTDFVPIKLPRNFKVVIRRYFRNWDVKYHSKSHIVTYVLLLKKCFIDFKKDKYESLYLNFNK